MGKSLKGLARFKDDPWFPGVFIDNEFPWYPNGKLAAIALEQGSGCCTKREAAAYLEQKFGSIDKLNNSWSTRLESWEDLAGQPLKLSEQQQNRARRDLVEFEGMMAMQYFGKCREMADKYLPGILYFGSRFSSFSREVVEAAKKYCDVVCFNIYAELPIDNEGDELAKERKVTKVEIKYSISLWNYFHYTGSPDLSQVISHVREQGCGIELWGSYKGESLYDEAGRKKIKPLLKDISVTLHTVGASNSFDQHKKQIDAAAELGAGLIVLHPDDLVTKDKKAFDADLARGAVAYAKECNVKLALENGPLLFLIEAIEKTEGLGICLDVGHVYFTPDPMAKFLAGLKHRLIHLHIQDILPEIEKKLPWRGDDHFIPGTGGIPEKDWKLLTKTLKEIDFRGIAVFEIQPRNPLQTALLGKNFLQKMLGKDVKRECCVPL